MFKVIVVDPISEEGLKSLTDHEKFEIDIKTGLSESEIVNIIGDYDALIVRSQTQITPLF